MIEGGILVPLAHTAPDRKRHSRLWVPLFGIVSPLTSVLCHKTFLVLFIDSLRLSALTEPGLRTPLNSYLEEAKYKFTDIWMDGRTGRWVDEWTNGWMDG